MIKNYATIAMRRLVREKLYVSINIFSLALGIAGFVILALYVRSELAYDHSHVNHRRIYRLTSEFQQTGRPAHFAVSQIGIGPLLVKDFPQLGTQVRFRPSSQNILTHGEKRRQWERVYLTDPTAFEVFTHQIIYGDPKTAFKDIYSIAISESMSKYYFGDENPIGKSISSGTYTYSVSLVYADLPENTHLKYDALYPIALMDVFLPGISRSYTSSLWSVDLYTYLMVPEEFQAQEFDTIAKGFVERYMSAQSRALKIEFTPHLQPLADAHFGEKLQNDQPTGNIFYVYGFAAVGIFILLIGCINYMNLATARATKRAKEVGMRKVLGASRGQLVWQFLGESYVLTAVALVLALLMAVGLLTLTPLGTLMNKDGLLAMLLEPAVLLSVLLLGLLVGLLSGLYPAFYLSAISPLAALMQERSTWRSRLSIRQVLVLGQLAISIAVIACTLLMVSQVQYLREKPLGFDKSNRLIVSLHHYDVVKHLPTIKSELLKEPGVLGVTTIEEVPGTGGNGLVSLPTETNDGIMEPAGVQSMRVGTNFADVLKIELAAGRSFSTDLGTDLRNSVLVNEAMVKRFGWQQPIGKRFRLSGGSTASVVGVVKDFHYSSLHNAINPLLILPISDEVGPPPPPNRRALVSSRLIVALDATQIAGAMQRVSKVVGRFDPKYQFEPIFLEDKLDALYSSEINLMKLTGVFGAFCILISMLGLYALAAFTTEQRTGEIGIRKVLGASDTRIMTLLSWHLVPLVAMAAIPASFVSHEVIGKWLERFAYHEAVAWSPMLLATVLVAAVALLGVGIQSLRAARLDPAKALRR